MGGWGRSLFSITSLEWDRLCCWVVSFYFFFFSPFLSLSLTPPPLFFPLNKKKKLRMEGWSGVGAGDSRASVAALMKKSLGGAPVEALGPPSPTSSPPPTSQGSGVSMTFLANEPDHLLVLMPRSRRQMPTGNWPRVDQEVLLASPTSSEGGREEGEGEQPESPAWALRLHSSPLVERLGRQCGLDLPEPLSTL